MGRLVGAVAGRIARRRAACDTADRSAPAPPGLLRRAAARPVARGSRRARAGALRGRDGGAAPTFLDSAIVAGVRPPLTAALLDAAAPPRRSDALPTQNEDDAEASDIFDGCD